MGDAAETDTFHKIAKVGSGIEVMEMRNLQLKLPCRENRKNVPVPVGDAIAFVKGSASRGKTSCQTTFPKAPALSEKLAGLHQCRNA
jgi:hypothetical protein